MNAKVSEGRKSQDNSTSGIRHSIDVSHTCTYTYTYTTPTLTLTLTLTLILMLLTLLMLMLLIHPAGADLPRTYQSEDVDVTNMSSSSDPADYYDFVFVSIPEEVEEQNRKFIQSFPQTDVWESAVPSGAHTRSEGVIKDAYVKLIPVRGLVTVEDSSGSEGFAADKTVTVGYLLDYRVQLPSDKTSDYPKHYYYLESHSAEITIAGTGTGTGIDTGSCTGKSGDVKRGEGERSVVDVDVEGCDGVKATATIKVVVKEKIIEKHRSCHTECDSGENCRKVCRTYYTTRYEYHTHELTVEDGLKIIKPEAVLIYTLLRVETAGTARIAETIGVVGDVGAVGAGVWAGSSKDEVRVMRVVPIEHCIFLENSTQVAGLVWNSSETAGARNSSEGGETSFTPAVTGLRYYATYRAIKDGYFYRTAGKSEYGGSEYLSLSEPAYIVAAIPSFNILPLSAWIEKERVKKATVKVPNFRSEIEPFDVEMICVRSNGNASRGSSIIPLDIHGNPVAIVEHFKYLVKPRVDVAVKEEHKGNQTIYTINMSIAYGLNNSAIGSTIGSNSANNRFNYTGPVYVSFRANTFTVNATDGLVSFIVNGSGAVNYVIPSNLPEDWYNTSENVFMDTYYGSFYVGKVPSYMLPVYEFIIAASAAAPLVLLYYVLKRLLAEEGEEYI